MAAGYTKDWIEFFTGCGIPNDAASLYALIFYENRIHKNMLLELNKEYLRDMGITVMGDIIAILRQARVIHEQYVKERILSDKDLSVNENCEISQLRKKSVSLKNAFEQYTVNPTKITKPKSAGEVHVMVSNNKEFQSQETSNENLEAKRNLSNIFVGKKKLEMCFDGNDSRTEFNKDSKVPALKIRKVSQKNDDCHNINVPKSTTYMSKNNLDPVIQKEIKTVFDRLGESVVSSTTEISSGSSGPITLTGSSFYKDKSFSVFSRLGGKTPVVSSTLCASNSKDIFSKSLQYDGVLKMGNEQKKHSFKTTMRADDEQQKAVMNQFNSVRVAPIKDRLGVGNGKIQLSQRSLQQDTTIEKRRYPADSALLKLNNFVSSSTTNFKDMSNINKNNIIQMNTTSIQKPVIIQGKAVSTTSNKLCNSKKWRLSSDAPSSLKKVRFGRTTERLIPAVDSKEPTSNVGSFPKLTMTVNNIMKEKNDSVKHSKILTQTKHTTDHLFGAKRLGRTSIHGRLGRRMSTVPFESLSSSSKKVCRIRDRLG